jgi:hypothetical protein
VTKFFCDDLFRDREVVQVIGSSTKITSSRITLFSLHRAASSAIRTGLKDSSRSQLNPQLLFPLRDFFRHGTGIVFFTLRFLTDSITELTELTEFAQLQSIGEFVVTIGGNKGWRVNLGAKSHR